MLLLREPCVTGPVSLGCHAVNFFETRQPRFDLFESGASEVPHAFLSGLRSYVARASQCENDTRDGFGDRQHLIDAHAALVAVCAAIASLRCENLQSRCDIRFEKSLFQQRLAWDIHRLLAVCAQSSRKALRDDQAHGGRNGVGFYAHIDESRQSLWRVVRMSVESTKCPVCAALIAISAVSRSRISPTMITSGSWRRNDRSAAAKVMPRLT